jgi:hypothetical protein
MATNNSGPPIRCRWRQAIARRDHRPAGVRLAVRSLTGCGQNSRNRTESKWVRSTSATSKAGRFFVTDGQPKPGRFQVL